MIPLIRSLFESALKTNDSLEFAVITGCLRISKESIFTRIEQSEDYLHYESNVFRAFWFYTKRSR